MADQTPDTNAPQAIARACRVCHAPLEPTQEWCLACGAATETGNRRLPGKRAAATVATLTLAITGGAVAAAYAALSSPPRPPKQLAQALPPGGTPDTSPTPAPTTTPTTPIPTTPTAKLPKLPKVGGPSPVPTIPSGTPSLPPPAPITTTTTNKPIPTTPPTTPTTPQPQVVELSLKPDDVIPYDPGSVIVSPPSNRAKLFDNDDSTAWTASAQDGATELGFGVTVDLAKKEELDKLVLSGKTGGIEIYGSTADELPQDVTDPGWKKIGGIDSLDGEKRITFLAAKKPKKYDTLLIWFTTAPASGPTVSLSSLGITVRR